MLHVSKNGMPSIIFSAEMRSLNRSKVVEWLTGDFWTHCPPWRLLVSVPIAFPCNRRGLLTVSSKYESELAVEVEALYTVLGRTAVSSWPKLEPRPLVEEASVKSRLTGKGGLADKVIRGSESMAEELEQTSAQAP